MHVQYGKGSKIFNSFLLLFSAKMLVISTGIHKMLVRIANREEPDAVCIEPVKQNFTAKNCCYFLIHQFKHVFWVLKRTVPMGRFF